MRLLEPLAAAFINTFGITQPSPRNQRRAAWFIFTMLLVVLGGLFTGAVLLFLHMARR